jgi:hypothetical protein
MKKGVDRISQPLYKGSSTKNSARAIPPIHKEVAMFSSSLSSAFEAATPAACKALLAQGITFTVAVENDRGEWFLLHAEDMAHAMNLAHNWVDVMGARGASIWRIFDDGIAPKKCGMVQPEMEWPDED